MNLKYIWSDRKYWFFTKPKQNFLLWLAWKLPKPLVERCFYRVVAHATVGKYDNTIVPELTAMEAIKRWDK